MAAHQQTLIRIAYAVSGDWTRAEDLLQNALFKLFRAWPRVKEDGRELAYARQVIVRANIDEMRRPRWRRETVGAQPATALSAEPDIERRHSLLEALSRLPRMQRSVVILRYWLGLSTEETASTLGISVGTVKSHAHKGLRRLRTDPALVDVES